jgi:hypothetical protein
LNGEDEDRCSDVVAGRPKVAAPPPELIFFVFFQTFLYKQLRLLLLYSNPVLDFRNKPHTSLDLHFFNSKTTTNGEIERKTRLPQCFNGENDELRKKASRIFEQIGEILVFSFVSVTILMRN